MNIINLSISALGIILLSQSVFAVPVPCPRESDFNWVGVNVTAPQLERWDGTIKPNLNQAWSQITEYASEDPNRSNRPRINLARAGIITTGGVTLLVCFYKGNHILPVSTLFSHLDPNTLGYTNCTVEESEPGSNNYGFSCT